VERALRNFSTHQMCARGDKRAAQMSSPSPSPDTGEGIGWERELEAPSPSRRGCWAFVVQDAWQLGRSESVNVLDFVV